jgi:uncharacterized protein YjiS (DUF1127 family)
MEGAMPGNDSKLEFFIGQYRSLNPAAHGRLRRLTIARAKTLRADYLRDLWRRMVTWYHARTAVTQLRGLDDAALKDIGLHRSGIEAAVRGGRVKIERREPLAEKPHFCLQRTG